jgi:hypothetical protein
MRTLIAVVAFGLFAGSAHAVDKTGICEKDVGGMVDCYVYAVGYSYRMCHQVQSIAVFEFGLEGASEGVNGKKYEFCVDKQKKQIGDIYRAAYAELRTSPPLQKQMRELHALWEASLAELPGRPGEDVEHYTTRVLMPYVTLAEEGSELQQATQEFRASRQVAAPKPTPAVAKTAAGKPQKTAKSPAY